MKKQTKILLLQLSILVVICSLSSKMLLGFVWVILHEAAHILVAKGFGINLFNMYIHITGVSAEIRDLDELRENKRLLVFLAGPLFNMGAIIILIWLKDSYNIILLESSILINLGLFIFNLLPAYPLDGVRIYEIILGKKILYKKAKQILVNISFGVGGALVGLFLLTIYIHKANFSLLLAAALITYSTFLEKEKTIYILLGNIIKKRRMLVKEEYIENKSVSVYYKKDLIKVLSLIDRNKFNSFFVLDEEMKLLGILYEDELINALKGYGNMTLEEFLNKRRYEEK